MTPLSITYLILGISMLFWPLALLLGKRRVLWAQWLIMLAISLMAFTHILYSCLFNSFLKSEYLLLILYMVFSLFTPPLATLAISRLLGSEKRRYFHLALVTSLLLALSVAIGGPDMYRLWIERGSDAVANLFFPNSWRYNLIVAVHYYLFWIVLTAEVLSFFIYTIRLNRRFSTILREYFTPSQHGSLIPRRGLLLLLLIGALVILHLLVFPFNSPRHLSTALIYAALLGTAVFVVGHYVYNFNYSADTLESEKTKVKSDTSHLIPHSSNLTKQVAAYVEEQACINPDLSVFELAKHFHVSQDSIVDAIHLHTGNSFAYYVDSLRVEHAAQLLTQAESLDDPDLLTHIAHRCGYLNQQDLQDAFQRIMHTSISKSGLV